MSGSQNDSGNYQQSGLQPALAAKLVGPVGGAPTNYVLIGDSLFPRQQNLIPLFKISQIDFFDAEVVFNTMCSSLRISVEQGIGKSYNL